MKAFRGLDQHRTSNRRAAIGQILLVAHCWGEPKLNTND